MYLLRGEKADVFVVVVYCSYAGARTIDASDIALLLPSIALGGRREVAADVDSCCRSGR